jgi:hypothetical protein
LRPLLLIRIWTMVRRRACRNRGTKKHIVTALLRTELAVLVQTVVSPVACSSRHALLPAAET